MQHVFLKVLLIMFAGCAFAAQEWPQYMGPHRDGSAAAPGLFDGEFSLSRIWIEPLGSGFSGIAVGGGRLYTMHTAGDKDALSCFDAETGKKRWSFAYGPTFPKVGNSEPGPLSTPVLDRDRVYGLGARGELFCLEAVSGKRVWSRDIVKELGAVPREVGIATSPLISGDFLILNVGDRKDKGIAAFDKKTGVLAWHVGEEEITFQSPALMTLMDREQVVALSKSKMRGLDPATGAVIWEQDSKDWLQVISIGDDLMLTGQYHGFALHRLGDARISKLTNWSFEPSDETAGFKAAEIWYNENLVLTYDMPVHHKGYLYGFKRSFLTCVNIETGEKVWSTRDTDRGMVILVNGHLGIISEDGTFRIARAWEKGYEERAAIKVFEASGLTKPSYADRTFYIRNYTHLAAVRVK